MPKISKEKIERDEKKLLKEFQCNARLSFNKLAKKCGFSKQKTWRIIRNLEENKTIWGYNTVFDVRKLGLKQFLIMVKRKSAKPVGKLVFVAINRVLKKKLHKAGILIQDSYYSYGPYDWILILLADDIIKINNFAESIDKYIQEKVADIQVVELLFPLEKSSIENPNKKELWDFFK